MTSQCGHNGIWPWWERKNMSCIVSVCGTLMAERDRGNPSPLFDFDWQLSGCTAIYYFIHAVIRNGLKHRLHFSYFSCGVAADCTCSPETDTCKAVMLHWFPIKNPTEHSTYLHHLLPLPVMQWVFIPYSQTNSESQLISKISNYTLISTVWCIRHAGWIFPIIFHSVLNVLLPQH